MKRDHQLRLDILRTIANYEGQNPVFEPSELKKEVNTASTNEYHGDEFFRCLREMASAGFIRTPSELILRPSEHGLGGTILMALPPRGHELLIELLRRSRKIERTTLLQRVIHSCRGRSKLVGGAAISGFLLLTGIVIILWATSDPVLWVLGSPNVCDRTHSVRYALEQATGRDCDIIRDADLTRVTQLRAGWANELKRSDFAGLVNLKSLVIGVRAQDDLPSFIRKMGSLRALSLYVFRADHNAGEIRLQENMFAGLDRLEILTIAQYGSELLVFPPGLFRDLDNLRTLSLGPDRGTINNCGDWVSSSCMYSFCTQTRVAGNWLTVDMINDLPSLDALEICPAHAIGFSDAVIEVLLSRGVKPFATGQTSETQGVRTR